MFKCKKSWMLVSKRFKYTRSSGLSSVCVCVCAQDDGDDDGLVLENHTAEGLAITRDDL